MVFISSKSTMNHRTHGLLRALAEERLDGVNKTKTKGSVTTWLYGHHSTESRNPQDSYGEMIGGEANAKKEGGGGWYKRRMVQEAWP